MILYILLIKGSFFLILSVHGSGQLWGRLAAVVGLHDEELAVGQPYDRRYLLQPVLVVGHKAALHHLNRGEGDKKDDLVSFLG